MTTNIANLKTKDTLCFPFCSDLGNKAFIQQNLDSQMNIKWSLFRIKQKYSVFGSGGAGSLPEGYGDLKIPGYFEIEKINDNIPWKEKEYSAFVAPSNYP